NKHHNIPRSTHTFPALCGVLLLRRIPDRGFDDTCLKATVRLSLEIRSARRQSAPGSMRLPRSRPGSKPESHISYAEAKLGRSRIPGSPASELQLRPPCALPH